MSEFCVALSAPSTATVIAARTDIVEMRNSSDTKPVNVTRKTRQESAPPYHGNEAAPDGASRSRKGRESPPHFLRSPPV